MRQIFNDSTINVPHTYTYIYVYIHTHTHTGYAKHFKCINIIKVRNFLKV